MRIIESPEWAGRLEREWNPFKNLSQPEEVSAYSKEKAWWVCIQGHEWQAMVRNRIKQKDHCPYCTGKKKSKVQSSTRFSIFKKKTIARVREKTSKLESQVSGDILDDYYEIDF